MLKARFSTFTFLAIILFSVFLFYSPLGGWLACEMGWRNFLSHPQPLSILKNGEGCRRRGEVSRGESIKYVHIAGQNIQVELALTPQEQAQGLSGRRGLKEGEGMLFVFPRPGKYSFWMKNMNFPIDIIWLADPPLLSEGGARGGDLKVIYIKKDAQPESYPETYEPDRNAKYVLEVTAGFSQKNNLRAGDKVQFIYQ